MILNIYVIFHLPCCELGHVGKKILKISAQYLNKPINRSAPKFATHKVMLCLPKCIPILSPGSLASRKLQSRKITGEKSASLVSILELKAWAMFATPSSYEVYCPQKSVSKECLFTNDHSVFRLLDQLHSSFCPQNI